MEIEFNETASRSPKGCIRSLDAEIARIAGAQHGLIALPQLVDLGLSPRAVSDRVAAGRLHRIHRGVFAVGHPLLSPQGGWMAAVLRAGAGAALSPQAAGAHRGLRAWRGLPTVTTPRRRRPSAVIRFHTAVLPPDEVTVLDGIPTTTVPRTIFDLASILDRRGLEQVIREAEVRGLSDPLSLPDLLARHPGRRGAANLQDVLADLDVGAGITRAELEARFSRFCDDFGIDPPERNGALTVAGRTILPDCLWRRARLIAELDGHGVHSRPVQIDADKERDRELMLAGWRVTRITWRHLVKRPEKLAADLRRQLGA